MLRSLTVTPPVPTTLTVVNPTPQSTPTTTLQVQPPTRTGGPVLNVQPTTYTGYADVSGSGGPRTTYTGPTAQDYKKYDHRTHVYMKPDTYIGSDEETERPEWLYNFDSNTIVNGSVKFPPGCERLFLEILTNASDNVGRSRRAGVDPGPINITMSNRTITIINYGLPIPVELAFDEKTGTTTDQYVPTMIFGDLLTSSNYEVDRHEAGTNGYGAKMTNIFSTNMEVVVHDAVRHLKFTQTWSKNMTETTGPVIEAYAGTASSAQVTYNMDFARFKLPIPFGNLGGYPREAFALFARHAIDISYNAKTKVTFNGQEFNYANIRDYARLYFGDAVDGAIVYYQWPEGTEVIKKKKGYQIAKNPSVVPVVELIAMDTPDAGAHVSFANCMMTRDGGEHVNSAMKAVGDSAVEMVNEAMMKRLRKQNKGREPDAKEKRSHTITIADVKPHLSLLLAVRVMNPKFTSQSKTFMHSPKPKIVVPESELTPIKRWALIDRLFAALEAKQFASLSKTDGKLKRYVRLQRGVDANQAGKAERSKCVLYITEGNSAAGYANKLLKWVPGGRDYVGVLPMRGKSLNVMNATSLQLENNAEIKELNKMLGLGYGVDYMNPDNYARLRYGSVMLMADADVDGKHIIGLILNYFHCRFPALLARGFVFNYCTPILRVFRGKSESLKFYTQQEYERWQAATPNYKDWRHKYYKGLGTSKEEEIHSDWLTPRTVRCYYDENAPAAIRLAFDKKLADQRKEWMGQWRAALSIEVMEMQPITDFINHELILFSLDNLKRSIPRVTDGFKESHRKIMHGAHLKWKIGPLDKSYTEMKVAQFGAFVADKACYHHGETILSDVVVTMTQDFMGANTIPWFVKEGLFGTRYQGGKDAAETRYSHTYPERLVAYILRKEDLPILDYVKDEGNDVEPITYVPIIPMILVNGAQGIGTGYATFVPNHNPLDIVAWLRARMINTPNEHMPDVLPWYRGFKGTITVVDRRRKKPKVIVAANGVVTTENGIPLPTTQAPKVDMAAIIDGTPADERLGDDYEERFVGEEEEEDDYDDLRPLLSMVTVGNFYIELNGKIVITELPIGRWPLSYHKWLEDMQERREITGFVDRSVDEDVYFEILGFKGTPTHRTLKLIRTFGMSNMTLLDEVNRAVRYDTAYNILEAFYLRRIAAYERRKTYILQDSVKQIEEYNLKIRFIQAVISGQIQFMNRKKVDVLPQMAALGLPAELLKTTKLSNCTEDDIIGLNGKIHKLRAEIETIQRITVEQMWSQELDEFETVYRRQYKEPVGKTKLQVVRGTPPTMAPTAAPATIRLQVQ